MSVYLRTGLSLTDNERQSDRQVGHRRLILSLHVPEHIDVSK